MPAHSQWIYIKDGQEHGPFSFPHLQSLHDTGQLSGDDIVRPYGSPVTESRPFSEVLLHETSLVRLSGDREGEHERAGEPQRGTLDWFKDKIDAWTAAASVTARRGVLQARRYRIAHSLLPAAYLQLGRVVRDQGKYRHDFNELYQELDDLAEEVAQLDPDEAAKAEFPSLVDQVRDFASRLTGYPQREMLASHARNILRELGRKAHDKYGDEAGPEHLVAELRRLRKRLDSLDEELARLDHEEHGTGEEARRAAADSFRRWVTTGRELVAEMPRAWSRARARAEDLAKKRREREELDQGAGI